MTMVEEIKLLGSRLRSDRRSGLLPNAGAVIQPKLALLCLFLQDFKPLPAARSARPLLGGGLLANHESGACDLRASQHCSASP
jgi:hypothetical protein